MTTATAHEIIHHIQMTETYLSSLTDKRPQPMLNTMLTKLVTLVQPVYDDTVVCSVLSSPETQARIKKIHPLLFQCECALEKYWAEKIITENDHYTAYPYMDCYTALCDSEVDALMHYDAACNSAVCFLGSGPMPISMFEMAKRLPDACITGVDTDSESVTLSRCVASLSKAPVDFVVSDARHIDYAAYDVVLLASMVIGKKDVFQRILETAKKGTLVAARSVDQLRHVLYEPVREEDIPQGFEYLGKTVYRPEHVNTTLFYRVT